MSSTSSGEMAGALRNGRGGSVISCTLHAAARSDATTGGDACTAVRFPQPHVKTYVAPAGNRDRRMSPGRTRTGPQDGHCTRTTVVGRESMPASFPPEGRSILGQHTVLRGRGANMGHRVSDRVTLILKISLSAKAWRHGPSPFWSWAVSISGRPRR